MRIKIFNTEIFITFSFSAFLALLLLIDRTGFLLPIFFAVITHELGHLIAMVILSSAPKSVTLKPFHIDISGFVPKTYKDRGVIAASGIISNAFFFIIFYLIYKITLNNYFLIYSAASFSVMLINALPTIGLDGGDILFLTLNMFLNKEKSIFILKIISIAIAFIIMLVAMLGILNFSKNIPMFIFGVYIIICTFLAKGEV